MHQLSHSSVLGSPIENGWSQVVTTSNQKLFCAIAVKGTNAKNVGFELVQLIESHSQFSPTSVHNLLLDLLKQARDREVVLQLSFICLIDSNNKASPEVILAAFQGQVLLKRSGKVATLLQADSELKLLSGSLKQEDEFLLATAQSEQLEQSIKQLLKNDHSLDSFCSNLEQKVRMLIDSSLFAISLTKINQLEKIKIVEPVPNNTNRFLEKLSISNDSLIKQKKIESYEQDRGKIGHAHLDFESTKNHADDTITTSDTNQNTSADSSKELGFSTDQAQENNQDITIKISIESIGQFLLAVSKKIKKFITHLFSWIKRNLIRVINFLKKKLKNKPTKKTEAEVDQEEFYSSLKNDESFESISTSSTRFTQVSNRLRHSKVLDFFNFFSKFSQKEIYLHKKNPKNIKVIIGAILLLLILGAAGLWIKTTIAKNHRLAETSLIPAQELLTQAEQLIDSDIIQARNKTSEAIELAIVSQKELENTRFVSTIFSNFIDGAKVRFQEIDGQIEVSQLEVFFDLSEDQPGFLTSVATSNDRTLFFADSQQKQLLALNPSTNQLISHPIDEIDSIKNVAASSENLYILNSGIYQAALEETQENESEQKTLNISTPQLIKEEGDSDRGGILMGFYESYLYVFNPEKRNIYRYVVRQDELSEPIGWLTNKQGIEFDKVFSMAIDGQIWLSTNEGKIIRLERGVPIEFSIEGLEKEFKNPLMLFTNSDTENLYILESEENRVVVLAKDGKFIKQIASPTLASATQLLVNENNKKAFAISGSIIYAIDL